MSWQTTRILGAALPSTALPAETALEICIQKQWKGCGHSSRCASQMRHAYSSTANRSSETNSALPRVRSAGIRIQACEEPYHTVPNYSIASTVDRCKKMRRQESYEEQTRTCTKTKNRRPIATAQGHVFSYRKYMSCCVGTCHNGVTRAVRSHARCAAGALQAACVAHTCAGRRHADGA